MYSSRRILSHVESPMNNPVRTIAIPLLLALASLPPSVAASAATAPVPSAAAPAAAAPAPAGDRITDMDVFNLETANDPQMSPDGRRVIYVRAFSDVFTDRRYANLWIVDTDGGGHQPLTSGLRGDDMPRWSPDGTRVAYVSDQDGTAQVYVRWLDSGQTARLTNLGFPPAGLAWSPDGRQIAFTTFVPQEGLKVANMPAPPEGAKWADPPTVIDKLIYRFDQAGYLKAGFTHLFVVPADGGTPRRISSGDFQHGGPAWTASDPVWTPDGRHILMSAVRRPDYEMEPLDTEIYEFAVADGAVRALTSRRGPDNSPAVSPDGRRVAYTGFDDRYQGYQVTRLNVMNRDGSGARALTAGLDRDADRPLWARDGSGIFFMYDDQGNTKLGFVTLDGRVKTVATDIGGPGGLYGGGTYSVGGPRGFALTRTRPEVPGDVAVGTADGTRAKPITALNDDLLGHKTLGEVEEIRYASLVDGRPIQGWIVKPPHFDTAKKYPLILEIHGGPFANYGDRFSYQAQLWAARDYVVLYVNPRGSTSYGEEFGNLIHHAYPGDDFHDLNSGVDAAIAKGYVDAENLFVTGGSGGGVLTCWMIGRTTRFRAAAAAYPVINWYSFLLTSDIPSFVARYWFPGLPWDHPEHYEKRSLLSVVKNVKTPTMVITGEEDYRTPISESEQYFAALRLLGVESVMVRVPGEPHGIGRRPSHWLAKMLNIVGWFDRHRKAGA
jgi:acylaminoacyl-peptidase